MNNQCKFAVTVTVPEGSTSSDIQGSLSAMLSMGDANHGATAGWKLAAIEDIADKEFDLFQMVRRVVEGKSGSLAVVNDLNLLYHALVPTWLKVAVTEEAQKRQRSAEQHSFLKHVPEIKTYEDAMANFGRSLVEEVAAGYSRP